MIGNLGGAMQGDYYHWSNDDGTALISIGLLDAGITTAQLQPSTGSAAPPGFCGGFLLPIIGNVRLSWRLGAMGLPLTAAHVGDSFWVYGDAGGDANGTGAYQYSGTQWIRTYPAPDTAVNQVALSTPDAGVIYTRSGKDPVTRIGFSSFWGD